MHVWQPDDLFPSIAAKPPNDVADVGADGFGAPVAVPVGDGTYRIYQWMLYWEQTAYIHYLEHIYHSFVYQEGSTAPTHQYCGTGDTSYVAALGPPWYIQPGVSDGKIYTTQYAPTEETTYPIPAGWIPDTYRYQPPSGAGMYLPVETARGEDGVVFQCLGWRVTSTGEDRGWTYANGNYQARWQNWRKKYRRLRWPAPVRRVGRAPGIVTPLAALAVLLLPALLAAPVAAAQTTGQSATGAAGRRRLRRPPARD